MLRKITLWSVGSLVALFIIVQFIPVAGAKTNPPVVAEPKWNNEQTKLLAERACYDCHSNQTDWPWYSNIAPVSWLVIHDVNEGRTALNFSTWGQGESEVDEAAETVREGTMPPSSYFITHPGAKLSEQERSQLITGLEASQ
jgi:Haem-binding domain